jgi:hypothetical protein
MNYFATRAFLLCFSSSIFLHAAQQEIQKPIIKGFIYPQALHRYETSQYHKNLCDISEIYSTVFIPVIQVNAFYANETTSPVEYDWTIITPKAIADYEHSIIENCNKVFPKYLPITLFYNKEEGDELLLNMHGYETHLICTRQLPQRYKLFGEGFLYTSSYNKTHATTTQNFSTHLNICMQSFQQTTFQIDDPIQNKDLVQFFIKNEVIEPIEESSNVYKHGKNGFKNLEICVLSLIHEKINMPMMLLLLQTKNHFIQNSEEENSH